MNKKQLMAMLAGVTLMCGVALGQSSDTTVTFNVNQAIPDGDANGLTLTTNLSGVLYPTLVGSITNVTLSVSISGGYNGDLYGYLARPGGQGFVVLFNRVGVTNTSQFGYSDSGFTNTFTSLASDNFHYYQTVGGYNLTGGSFLPDGRNIDPQSDPNLFGSTGPSTSLNSFNGFDPNGNWTLFLADLSAGEQSTILSWTLDITTVPEPSTLALSGVGLAGAMLLIRRRSRK